MAIGCGFLGLLRPAIARSSHRCGTETCGLPSMCAVFGRRTSSRVYRPLSGGDDVVTGRCGTLVSQGTLVHGKSALDTYSVEGGRRVFAQLGMGAVDGWELWMGARPGINVQPAELAAGMMSDARANATKRHSQSRCGKARWARESLYVCVHRKWRPHGRGWGDLRRRQAPVQ